MKNDEISPDALSTINEALFSFFCVTELSPVYKIQESLPAFSFQDLPLKRAQSESTCSCKKTRCLKLYCECFAKNALCGPECSCKGCKNNPRRAKLRSKAVTKILKKKPEPFLKEGCHCKKTECLKNYCVCFQEGLKCSESCNCTGCKNTNTKYVDFI